jgi:hypothetical protein
MDTQAKLQAAIDIVEDIHLEAEQQLKSRHSADDARAALKLMSRLTKLMLDTLNEGKAGL